MTKSKSKVELPNGTYNGYWGGYVVEIVGGEFNGYKFDTVHVIKTLRAHVTITVNSGDATIHTSNASPEDIIHTSNNEGESILLWVRKVETQDDMTVVETYNNDIDMTILIKEIDDKIYASELKEDKSLRKLDWITIYRKIK